MTPANTKCYHYWYQDGADELESPSGIVTDTKDVLETVVDFNSLKKIVCVCTQTWYFSNGMEDF